MSLCCLLQLGCMCCLVSGEAVPWSPGCHAKLVFYHTGVIAFHIYPALAVTETVCLIFQHVATRCSRSVTPLAPAAFLGCSLGALNRTQDAAVLLATSNSYLAMLQWHLLLNAAPAQPGVPSTRCCAGLAVNEQAEQLKQPTSGQCWGVQRIILYPAGAERGYE